MEVIQRVRVACPRCGAAVTGDFKFCPTCAYRLKPGAVPAETAGAPRPPSFASAVLAVAAALFVGLIAGIGVWIFRDQAESHPTTHEPGPPPALAPEGLTLATLRQYMRRVPAGIAYYWEENGEGNGPWIPMQVDDLDVLMYEVTRSLWAEFFTDVRARVRAGEEPPPSLRSLWNAESDVEKEYARNYMNEWFYDYLDHQKLGPETRRPLPEYVLAFLPEEGRKEMARLEAEGFGPLLAFVKAMPFPWPRELGLLLLAPPSWASVNVWAEWAAEVPHDTGSLPVTEVTWTDAVAFGEWATERSGGSLRIRLPVEGEWLRIAHGGHPAGGPSDEKAWDFPWGKTMLRYACNSAELYRTRVPVLQVVGFPYRDVDDTGVHDGTTVDGIFDMAGNAWEWVLDESADAQRVNGVYRVHYDAASDRDEWLASTMGGSYTKDLSFCRVRAFQTTFKYKREVDVGFRLVAEPLP